MPGPSCTAAAGRRAADRVDRVFVGAPVALGIGGRERGLAEHVVRMAEPFGFERAGVRERLADRLAGDELLAHDAHRAVDALPDQRLAALADQPSQRARQTRLAVRRDELAGEHQRPGGGIDEERRALAEMLVPLAGADLVADERVARRGIGDAQQRLGQAHQRHAFLRRERIFLEQALDETRAAGVGLAVAQGLRQPAGERLGRRGELGLQPSLAEQRGHDFDFGPPTRGGDRGAQRRRRRQEIESVHGKQCRRRGAVRRPPIRRPCRLRTTSDPAASSCASR